MKEKCAWSSAFRRLSIPLAFLLALPTVFAATTTVTPSADATLYEVNPQHSSGGFQHFFAGTTGNSTSNRALLQFDIASAVPAGSRITSVSLELEVNRAPVNGFEASLFGFHRVLRSWGEGDTTITDHEGGLGAPAAPGDATWLDRFHGSLQPWAAPGGAPGIDYVADFSGSVFLFGPDVYQVEGTPDLISDVQFWLDNPQANFGWMLISTSEDLDYTARRFSSSENPDGGGPVMFIEYEPVPEPATWALLGVGALCLAAFRRAAAKQ